MSSETITRNDLTSILNEVLPPTPSEYKKLLWTNPNPTSAMSGGTTIVASGADEYDAIEVEYKTAHIYDGYETASAPFVVGAHITLFAPAGTGGEFSGANYNAVRTISMGAGGVLMVDGAVGMTSSGTTANNNMCIPYKVYGIKYERVQPPVLDAEIEVLATGATLYRIGRIRILSLVDFPYGTSLTVGVGDRPTTKAVGTGIRDNSSAYITFLRIEVNTNGSVNAYLGGYFNTSNGYSLPVSGDIFNATVVWYVAE